MSHMTQTANPVTLLASPLGEEGHKVAKGWTVVILIMILDVDVTAEGGIIKLIARKGATTTLAAVGCVKLKNPPAARPVNPKNPHAAGVSKGEAAMFFPFLFSPCGII